MRNQIGARQHYFSFVASQMVCAAAWFASCRTYSSSRAASFRLAWEPGFAFAGERVASFSGFSTTNWAFDVDCVHIHSLLTF
jgi:hypothetical protein